jgi:hypothetical protein
MSRTRSPGKTRLSGLVPAWGCSRLHRADLGGSRGLTELDHTAVGASPQIKVAVVLSNPMHDDGQLAGNGDFGPTHADATGKGKPPRFER